MEQTNISVEEMKKVRREMKMMNQTLDNLRNGMEGIHQTLSSGLKKLFSEIEILKIENHKIKSNLKYVMKMKTGESSFYSDSDVRSMGTWYGSRESLGIFSGNTTPSGSLPLHKLGHVGSDYTDDDRETLMSDIIEEDSARKGRKEKRKQYQNRVTPEPATSSDSDSTRIASNMATNKQLRDINTQRSMRQNSIETDQFRVEGPGFFSNVSTVPKIEKHINVSSDSLTSSSVTSSTSGTSGNLNSEPSGTSSSVSSGTSKNESGASSTVQNDSSIIDAVGSNEEIGEYDGYCSDELDTNIEMEVETKCQVLYPHLIKGYEPVMVPYDQIKFNDPKQYLRSLGFCLIDQTLIEFMKRMAMVDNKKNDQLPRGLYTVLLLDTSYGTGPGGMYEVRKFVHDFLEEIETATEHNLEEMICMFEMGSCNGVLHEFTNDYSLLRESLDKIDKCGGRSNLWTSLIGLFCYLHKKSKKCVINGRTHGVRIVWVSDGNVTDDMHVLSNSENEADLERIQDRILKFMPYLLREKMVLSAVEVGMDSEPEFLERFVKKGKGQYGHALWGKHVGRYYLYQHIIGKILPDLRDPQNRGKIKEVIQKHTAEFDYFNKTDIAEISLLLRDRYKFTVPEDLLERVPLPEYDDDHRIELYTKELFPRIPPIGTRVKPGDKFKDRHKQYYKGTVVAHCRSNTVVVKWDEEIPQPKIYFYKYEIENHEVDVIYEFRKIDMSIPGYIGTGCRVRRGVSWDRGDEDGGPRKIGIVVRKHAGKYVTVKWPNSKRERYRFGAEDCYDLEIVPEEEILIYNTEKDKEEQLKAKVKVLQWELEDADGQWRTLDEEGNNAVINYWDMQKGERGKAPTTFQGAGYYFYLDRMEYELKANQDVKGKIRVEEVTVQEQEKRRDHEFEQYKRKKGENRRRQAVQGGQQFLSQMAQGGGMPGLAGMLGQGGNTQLAGLLESGGLEQLAGSLGPEQQEQLAAYLSQPGAQEQLAYQLSQGRGDQLAGMFGQGGGNPMMGGRGQGHNNMSHMYGGQGIPGQGGTFGQGVPSQGGTFGQGMPGQGGIYGQGMPGQGGMYHQGMPGQGGMNGQGDFGGMRGQQIGGPTWQCSACTYENESQFPKCIMCGQNRTT